MKQIFKEWGGTIVVVIAVVALIGLVSLLMQPGGVLNGAFGNIVQSFVDKSGSLIDLAGAGGADDSGENGGSAGESHVGVIPEGAYYMNTETGTFYNRMPETVSDGDVYLYGDYVYGYDRSADGWSVMLATEDLGISAYVPDFETTDLNQTTYGPILESINNKFIVSLYSTFENCSSMTAAPAFPAGLTSIGNRAFANCSSLESITIPETINSLGARAFSMCSSLTNVTLGNSVTDIGALAFEGCISLERINIPGSVTKIGMNAFESCKELTSVEIPNSVDDIGAGAFAGCSNLAQVKLPDNLTVINSSVFSCCEKLTSVEIPNSVTNINNLAFYDCTNLTSITYNGTVEQWNTISFGEEWNYGCSAITINCTNGTNGTVVVPAYS